MKRGYRRRTERSRRKNPRELKGKILGKDEASVQVRLPIAEAIAGMEGAIEAIAMEAGLLVMKALIDDEVEKVAGRHYMHEEEKNAHRWGKEDGYVVMGGKKLPFERPRVRTLDGKEVPLQRYSLFHEDRAIQRSVVKHVLGGVSTRNYEKVIDDVCDGYGVMRSSVSRHWKMASAEELRKLLEKDLGSLDLLALMIDGIAFHDHLLIVALGFARNGTKHVLGLWEGATESYEVSKALLDDLVERGLDAGRNYLVVIDGSKGLRKAVKATLGARAVVQRCQVHKERNILSHLPEKYHPTVRMRLRAAYKMKSYEKAKDALSRLLNYLEDLNPSAAASLREGMDETLSLHRLGVPDRLHRIFRSTNPIESCFSRTRELCRNVKRWRNSDMAQRWAGTMLLHAQYGFKRIQGFRELPALTSVLIKNIVEVESEVA